MRLADSGVEETEEVIDLRDGPDGAPGVFVGRFLFDRDNGTKAGYFVDVGSFHIADELPGVGAEAFHIAALSFRVDGIEGERGFTASADTGNDHQLIFGDTDVYVLEIVHPGTRNLYYFLSGLQPDVDVLLPGFEADAVAFL